MTNTIDLSSETGRERVGLSGYWRFKTDLEERGEGQAWFKGSGENWDILHVPGNWNEQVPDYTWYMGTAWYARSFQVPQAWQGKAVWLCFDGLIYKGKVWVNNTFVGEHEGGFTAFRFRAEHVIAAGKLNTIVVMVDNKLSFETIPAGEGMNKARFDFFHYGGIHRAVYLEAAPKTYIADQTIRTATKKGGARVTVITVLANEQDKRVDASLTAEVCDRNRASVAATKASVKLEPRSQKTVELQLDVKQPRLWCFENPYLYFLKSGLKAGGEPDRAETSFGIRSIAVKGCRILLNGKPVLFKGASRHEDFPVLGKALNGAVIRRDYAAMQTIGANSFRTIHYPYSKEYIELADELGILVTLEIPTVGLMAEMMANPVVMTKVKKVLAEAIATYKNNPSVWMWSIANEPWCSAKPIPWVDPQSTAAQKTVPNAGEVAKLFFRELYDYAKKLDPTRPVTVEGPMGEVFPYENLDADKIDVLTPHLYHGWYDYCGDIEGGVKAAARDLDELHKRHPDKPMLLTEFGAEAIHGFHADPPEMWSEEYQAEFHRQYLMMILEKSKTYLSGGQLWTLFDIRTPQSINRTMLNRKGIFTRTREPKAAVKVVQAIYKSVGNYVE